MDKTTTTTKEPRSKKRPLRKLTSTDAQKLDVILEEIAQSSQDLIMALIPIIEAVELRHRAVTAALTHAQGKPPERTHHRKKAIIPSTSPTTLLPDETPKSTQPLSAEQP